MKNKDDGGPAFPYSDIKMMSSLDPIFGMSLRDYFAAKALQGIVSNPVIMEYIDNNAHVIMDMAVKISYSYADAMLKAREE